MTEPEFIAEFYSDLQGHLYERIHDPDTQAQLIVTFGQLSRINHRLSRKELEAVLPRLLAELKYTIEYLGKYLLRKFFVAMIRFCSDPDFEYYEVAHNYLIISKKFEDLPDREKKTIWRK